MSKIAALCALGFGVIAAFAVSSGFAQQAPGSANGMTIEQNVDRPGNDYASFDMTAGGWQACQAACTEDKQCKAFTYVRPGVQGPNSRCWLKNAVPPPAPNGCCVSGAAQADAAIVEGSVVQGPSRVDPSIFSQPVKPPPPAPPPPPPPQRTNFYCRQYADMAARYFTLAQRRRQCAVQESPRWNANRDGHYDWCMSAPREQVIAEAQARDAHLLACGAIKSF